MLASDVAPLMTAFFSVLVGILFMFISMSLFYLVSKMQRSGNINLKNAIGATGEVYIPIPANRQSYGKIMVVIQGGLRELEAITDETEELKTGTKVTIVSVEGESKLLVKKQ